MSRAASQVHGAFFIQFSAGMDGIGNFAPANTTVYEGAPDKTTPCHLFFRSVRFSVEDPSPNNTTVNTRQARVTG